jgi:hypothetical protein
MVFDASRPIFFHFASHFTMAHAASLVRLRGAAALLTSSRSSRSSGPRSRCGHPSLPPRAAAHACARRGAGWTRAATGSGFEKLHPPPSEYAMVASRTSPPLEQRHHQRRARGGSVVVRGGYAANPTPELDCRCPVCRVSPAAARFVTVVGPLYKLNPVDA